MTQFLAPGQPAPWFKAAALDGNPDYRFHTAGGRWHVLLLLGSAAPEAAQAALRLVALYREMFDDDRACFFGVTIDPDDAAQRRIAQSIPGVRWFLDYDRAISRQFGALDPAGGESGGGSSSSRALYRPHWLLLDPMLRVRRVAALADGAAIMAELQGFVAGPGEVADAPVLVVPEVLPGELCRELIALYERNGGRESGLMREEGGVTIGLLDHARKRRADWTIDDGKVVGRLKALLGRSLAPMIKRAFQFEANRIERFIVACYDGEQRGGFRAHRDNTTGGTAHRRFACTINLNAEEYDGGDLRFPEFGPRAYRAPTGGAVVFSCSLLHEALPVTRGRRYAFLPFFYDDEGARIREANMAHIAPEYRGYRSGLPQDREVDA